VNNTLAVLTSGEASPGEVVQATGTFGLIAALIGKGLAAFAAAQLGVYWHGLAGDLLVPEARAGFRTGLDYSALGRPWSVLGCRTAAIASTARPGATPGFPARGRSPPPLDLFPRLRI